MLWITEFCEEKHKKIHNNHSTWSKAQNQTEDFWNRKEVKELQQRKTRKNTRSEARALNQD